MDSFSCDECRAIYWELGEAYRAVAGGPPDRNNAPQQIGDWVRQLNEGDCAWMRETSSLWKTWRRLREHRSRTGHTLSVLPLPPNAISNPN